MTPTLSGTDKHGRAFLIRSLEDQDGRALREMYESFEPKRVAQGLPPARADQIARWLDGVLAGGSHLVVVDDEGRVAGHGMLLPYAPGAAELANFLHQSVRDRGIGTALNRALLDLARAQDIATVWLSVEPSNRRAIRSYEKVGFRLRPVSTWSPEIEMEIETRAAPSTFL
jgi:ribosomal protein S18 acetylase RimI-like enzyme